MSETEQQAVERAKVRHPAKGTLSLADSIQFLLIAGVIRPDEIAEGNR